MRWLRDDLEWLLDAVIQAVMVIVILGLSYAFYASEFGHWYLCDTPGNTRPWDC